MQTRRSFLISASSVLAAPSILYAADEEIFKPRAFYRKDSSFTEFAKSLEGRRVTVEGFMAPPLKAGINFFVLTKMPMAVCPFCETEAEWPDDILAIYTKRTLEVEPFNKRILTRGTLELGPFKDPDTGFLSLVRLLDATYG